MKLKFIVGLLVAALVAVSVYLWWSGTGTTEVQAEEKGKAAVAAVPAKSVAPRTKPRLIPVTESAQAAGSAAKADDAPDAESAPTLTPEERAEALEDKLVEVFDKLTDKWMEPVKGGVSMKDVENFVSAFRQIPKARQDECIHRALNLIPDDNVMLLVGVLLDKSIDKEIVETTFNDILNRDEEVKKPILKEIFKDKNHPCWADVAWILDATGEKK